MVVLSGVAGSLWGVGGRTPRVSEDKRTRTNARAAHTRRRRAGQRVGGALGDVGGGPCSRAEGGGPLKVWRACCLLSVGAGGADARVSEDKHAQGQTPGRRTRDGGAQASGLGAHSAMWAVGRVLGPRVVVLPPAPPLLSPAPANVGMRCGSNGISKKAEKPTVRGKSARKAAFPIEGPLFPYSLRKCPCFPFRGNFE